MYISINYKIIWISYNIPWELKWNFPVNLNGKKIIRQLLGHLTHVEPLEVYTDLYGTSNSLVWMMIQP